MPHQGLARILIQIIQPATATARNISKAHTYCTDRTLIKNKCAFFVLKFYQVMIAKLL